MLKNTSGQKVGAQLVSAVDGSAFTGSVTVAVTVDAGSQATGTVGAGAATHEGQGYHTYAPTQAETNGDLVAFTFTGTGAVPATVQVYTRAGDAFTRLGAPAGASVSADIAAVHAKTTNLPADPADASDVLAATTAIAGYVDTELLAVKAVTDKLDTALELDGAVYRYTVNALEQAPAGGGGGSTDWTADERTSIRAILGIPGSGTTPADPTTGILDTIRDAVGVVDDFLDTEVAAIKAKTDLIPSDPADQSAIEAAIDAAEAAILAAIPSAASNATALLDTSNGVETSITPRQALRLILAASAGKLSGAATTTVTIRNVGDTKARITATVDGDGNRTAVTTDAT